MKFQTVIKISPHNFSPNYIPILKLLNKILLTFGTGLAAGLSLQAQSVLDVSNASLSPTVVLPQSFETDTKKMLEDWYLRNYAVLDYDADSRGSESVSDQVLLERLSALPTEIEMPLNAPVKSVINFYVNRKKQLVQDEVIRPRDDAGPGQDGQEGE